MRIVLLIITGIFSLYGFYCIFKTADAVQYEMVGLLAWIVSALALVGFCIINALYKVNASREK